MLHQILGFLRYYYDGNNPFEKSEKFNQRRVDCVKVLAKAAGMVNPKEKYRCIICASRLKHVIITESELNFQNWKLE